MLKVESTINITGTGCICGAGSNVSECMLSMYAGRRNPVINSRIKADLKTIYPVFEIDKNIIEELEQPAGSTLTNIFLLKAVKEALAQAGLLESFIASSRIGVCIGTTVGCTLNNEYFYREYKKGNNPDIYPVKKYLNNNPAKFISKRFNLTGPVAVISNACSSGTDAIGLAKLWLENGLCDIAIAGGTDELSRIPYLGFSSMQITSREPCKPFDKHRDGLNLGEGAGIVILEKEDSVKKRGARPLAELRGYSCSSDAYHPTAPHPEGTGLKKAVKLALGELNPEDIDFINAHGTSTRNNDETEGRVISEIYKKDIPVISTKAYTGHTLGAAGGIEAVFTVKCLIDGKLPSTAGFSVPDENCKIKPTTETINIHTDYAVSHSLAFGGNNSVLLLRRAE